ncbi:MAG TPA: HAD family hydrolase [Caulobacteraceae bacterium]|jgi:hypothetical protein
MIFLALAADYDGTLARDGRVDATTTEALRRLRSTGRRLILVTGRHLEDLRRAFDALGLFDAAVVENGALVFFPQTERVLQIGAAPPPALIRALQNKGVEDFSVGRGIVSTSEAHQTAVFEAIRELNLDWQVIFNKGAAMVLPAGVDKGAGLKTALAELGVSRHSVVGIGDAENDQPFLSICGCSVAVANALPAVKASVDMVTTADDGVGATEFIERWLDEGDRLFAQSIRRDAAPGETADPAI